MSDFDMDAFDNLDFDAIEATVEKNQAEKDKQAKQDAQAPGNDPFAAGGGDPFGAGGGDPFGGGGGKDPFAPAGGGDDPFAPSGGADPFGDSPF